VGLRKGGAGGGWEEEENGGEGWGAARREVTRTGCLGQVVLLSFRSRSRALRAGTNKVGEKRREEIGRRDEQEG